MDIQHLATGSQAGHRCKPARLSCHGMPTLCQLVQSLRSPIDRTAPILNPCPPCIDASSTLARICTPTLTTPSPLHSTYSSRRRLRPPRRPVSTRAGTPREPALRVAPHRTSPECSRGAHRCFACGESAECSAGFRPSPLPRPRAAPPPRAAWPAARARATRSPRGRRSRRRPGSSRE